MMVLVVNGKAPCFWKLLVFRNRHRVYGTQHMLYGSFQESPALLPGPQVVGLCRRTPTTRAKIQPQTPFKGTRHLPGKGSSAGCWTSRAGGRPPSQRPAVKAAWGSHVCSSTPAPTRRRCIVPSPRPWRWRICRSTTRSLSFCG